MKRLSDLALHGKRVLMRVDFNVPLADGAVVNDFRVRASLPSIEKCRREGASVVLMSHLGRPKGKRVPDLSLVPVGECLSDLLESSVKFSSDCISDESVRVSEELKPGEVHLLENLRFHPGESLNEERFSRRLARHGNVYVNDAFGTAHRSHASNVGVTAFVRERAAGILLDTEVRNLDGAIRSPRRPFVVILGGAKVEGKLNLIERFLREADHIVIGGAMAFTFLKAQGRDTGSSLVQEGIIPVARKILQDAVTSRARIHLPSDFAIAITEDPSRKVGDRSVEEFASGEVGKDIGRKTILAFESLIARASTVVWNGPMGVFEEPDFRLGTHGVAQAVAALKKRGAVSVIGGGDTAACVEALQLEKSMTHVSTGGGASLELLAGRKLPALEALA